MVEEYDSVLDLYKDSIHLFRDVSDIEALNQLQQEVMKMRKEAARVIQEAHERDENLAATREKLMTLRRAELQTALPHVNVGELERTSSANLFEEELQRTREKNSKLDCQRKERDKVQLEARRQMYIHDLQRTVAPVQFDIAAPKGQIRGYIKRPGHSNIQTFNFDTKTAADDTITSYLWKSI